MQSLVQDDVICRQRKERVGFAREIGNAILDRRVYDRIVVELVGDGFVVAFEEVLVDAIVFIEELQSGFETLRKTIDGCGVETLVIHAAHFEDDADLSALGEKSVWTDESVEIDLLRERAGLVVVLEDSAKPEHGHPFGSRWD